MTNRERSEGHLTEEPRFSYPRPPIVEALCQVYFGEPLRWNPAVPGLVYSEIRDRYPQEPEAQPVNTGIQVDFSDGQEPRVQLSGVGRSVYRESDGHRLVILNEDSISVNCLQPYEGWPSLKARLIDVLESVSRAVEINSISKVVLRYINRVPVPPSPTGVFNTDDYFNVVIRVPSSGEAGINGVFHRTEGVIKDGHDTAVLSTFASALPEDSEADSGAVFIIDLELQRAFPSPVSIEDAMKHAEEIKELENVEFEGYITDKARELFQ